nr:HAD-IIB family hydrolase [Lacticaseibacillus camelliae]
MTPYLIVSDVDGTLAIDNTTITAHTSAVINQLLDRGHQFYLATGRMHALAENMAKQIGPRAEIIASNGASYDTPGGRSITCWEPGHWRQLRRPRPHTG